MDLSTVRFGVGTHAVTDAPTGARDLCIMEAVAYMAGEPWSDSPECASPVVSRFVRAWQDALSDDDRDRLLPAEVWVPRLVGSRGDDATEERRAYLALDWLVRVHAPAWIDLVPKLARHAAALRALPEIIDIETAVSAGLVVRLARYAGYPLGGTAGTAAWDAARYTARYAAEATAGYAVVGTAQYAAWAAWDAAWDAAQYAAWAAWDAAWDAAGYAAGYAGHASQTAAKDILRPTVETLQQSALDLLDRMLARGEHPHGGTAEVGEDLL